MTKHHKPIWDRGQQIDGEMMTYTIGDDWQQDQRLVEVDIRGSIAHVSGLIHAGLLPGEVGANIQKGLADLLESWRRGEWNVEAQDEDVHSAIERRLIDRIGEDGGRMHLGRSRNDQVAVDMRLWLRRASEDVAQAMMNLIKACGAIADRDGHCTIPGYTHLRRAMPSTLWDWIGAHEAAFSEDLEDLDRAATRWSRCPLGSGSGYGIPLPLDREFVAEELGFVGPEVPVTAVQHQRGRAELAYASVLESIALDIGKLAADLWLYSTGEFGFVKLPVAFTTGSSLMPQKRNPDLIELLRGNARQVVADRAALLAVVQDLPSGYHRDFQLIKPPLFRAHDRTLASVRILARFLPELEFQTEVLNEASSDPELQATAKALTAAAQGQSFRQAYRETSLGGSRD
ncbi:MAG: argininosuccinate lyase [Planctomycetes bacterium]|nr:argininosuccinate lyase [Planctomycetota bacterium]